jgi:hypothetical protein
VVAVVVAVGVVVAVVVGVAVGVTVGVVVAVGVGVAVVVVVGVVVGVGVAVGVGVMTSRKPRAWWLVVNAQGLAVAVKNWRKTADLHADYGCGGPYSVIRVVEAPPARKRRNSK